jgi:hypothetical protein
VIELERDQVHVKPKFDVYLYSLDA